MVEPTLDMFVFVLFKLWSAIISYVVILELHGYAKLETEEYITHFVYT